MTIDGGVRVMRIGNEWQGCRLVRHRVASRIRRMRVGAACGSGRIDRRIAPLVKEST